MRNPMNVWVGTADDWPDFFMVYLAPDITRVLIDLRAGGRVEIAVSPILPEFSARLAAGELREEYGDTLTAVAQDGSITTRPVPRGFRRRGADTARGAGDFGHGGGGFPRRVSGG